MSPIRTAICPYKYYSQIENGGGETIIKLKSAYAALAVGNDQDLVALVTGKIIRVMGYKVHSTTGAQGAYSIQDGTLNNLDGGFAPPLAGLPFLLPITKSGYFETTVSTALKASVVTAAIAFTIFYIEYNP
jgi:hypothetical protein